MTESQTKPPSAAPILLASDLSCRCDRAMERAALLAAEWGVALNVVTAVERDFQEPSWRSLKDTTEAAVRAELALEFEDRDLKWDVTVEPGAAAQVVVDAAVAKGSQLIVTGVARNELLGRSSPGRTVETLMRHAPVPVLLVKKRPHGPYRRILVPTDFSLAAELATARTALLFPSAEISLLHAYRVPFAGFISETAHQDELRVSALEHQEEFLARVKARIGDHAPPMVLTEYGSPEQLVAEYVAMQAPDLVVIGARPREGLLGAMAVGMAERLASAALCDVLVVPQLGDPE